MKPIVLLFADLVAPRQVQGQWKWHKMVEVNGAYKHGKGKMKQNWFQSLRVMTNIKVSVK